MTENEREDWRETDPVETSELTEEDILQLSEDAKSLGDLRSRLGDVAGARGESPIPERDNWEKDAIVLEELEEQAAAGEPLPEELFERLPDLLKEDVRRLYEAQSTQDDEDDFIVG